VASIIEITREEAASLTSPFDVSVQAPEDVQLEAAELHTLEFEVANIGTEPDSYSLYVRSGSGIAQPGILGGTIDLLPGEIRIVEVPIEVSSSAVPGREDEVTLEVYSTGSAGIFESDSVIVEVVPEPALALSACAAVLALVALAGLQRRSPSAPRRGREPLLRNRARSGRSARMRMARSMR
jgi:hypothetical protein